MAVAYRALTQNGGTATSVTGTEPTGTVADDIMIAILYRETAVSNTITPPGTWTDVFNGTTLAQDVVSVGQEYTANAYWIRRTGSAPSFAWSWTSSAFHELVVVSYSGCTTSGDPSSFGTQAERDNASTSAWPAVSGTTIENDELLAWFGLNFNGSTSTPPTGSPTFTERLDIGTGDITVADATLATAGSTGSITGATWSGVAGPAVVFMMGLRPPGSASTVLGSLLGQYTPFTTNYAGRL